MRKKYDSGFTVSGLMLRIEPATPWQSPNKLGFCAWLKRSLQVMWFHLPSYIFHLTSDIIHQPSSISPLTSFYLLLVNKKGTHANGCLFLLEIS